ncbi:hypothetical protein Aduo_009373 [Ancylostoma duodenale]
MMRRNVQKEQYILETRTPQRCDGLAARCIVRGFGDETQSAGPACSTAGPESASPARDAFVIRRRVGVGITTAHVFVSFTSFFVREEPAFRADAPHQLMGHPGCFPGIVQ